MTIIIMRMKLLRDHVSPNQHLAPALLVPSIRLLLIFLCSLSAAGLTTEQSRNGGRGGRETSTTLLAVPKIESLKPNTTAFVGQTAYLQCIVKHLGDKTVSWIRRKDLHILTSGNHVYTSDPRVQLLLQGKISNAWTLKITQVQKKDEGQYECQVNTEPKSTYAFHLVVVGAIGASNNNDEMEMKTAGWRLQEAPPVLPALYQHDSIANPKLKVTEARLLGPERLEIEEGSSANFTCIISHPGLAAPNITWFYNDIPVKQSSAILGGINIETEKSLFSTISKLVIVRVDPRNQGKYSCGGRAIYPASVVLRILPDHSSKPELASSRISSAPAGPSWDLRDKGGTWLAITMMMLFHCSAQDSFTMTTLAIPFFMAESISVIKTLVGNMKNDIAACK